MLTVAYLANLFPSPLEPYVAEEIAELRSRGVQVIVGSVRKPPESEGKSDGKSVDSDRETVIVLQPLGIILQLQALWLCMRAWNRVAPLIARILFRGSEGPLRRLKALLHTWLGACYAVRLEERARHFYGDHAHVDRIHVDHIHVHHGYFGSWIGMTAARLLGTGFSMTLHGSDLLLHAAYLDTKLKSCTFCLTVSEYNRRYILERYPEIQPGKIVVSRLGVELAGVTAASPDKSALRQPSLRMADLAPTKLALLSVGRLHAVKDHAFLVRACAQLRTRGVRFECSIAGDGPERKKLESLIRRLGLEDQVTLLGHVAPKQMDSLYDRANVVVLTSRSEGVPLVLMEAMARGKIVLAPAITGIPELVRAGQSGFLYEAGSAGDFVARLLFIHSLMQTEKGPLYRKPQPFALTAARQLDWVRHAAQVQIRHNFNRSQNLKSFGDSFLERIAPHREGLPHENFVLQQI
jgi:colanic acid/amylovoran biosynthesis glycosyltransferase